MTDAMNKNGARNAARCYAIRPPSPPDKYDGCLLDVGHTEPHINRFGDSWDAAAPAAPAWTDAEVDAALAKVLWPEWKDNPQPCCWPTDVRAAFRAGLAAAAPAKEPVNWRPAQFIAEFDSGITGLRCGAMYLYITTKSGAEYKMPLSALDDSVTPQHPPQDAPATAFVGPKETQVLSWPTLPEEWLAQDAPDVAALRARLIEIEQDLRNEANRYGLDGMDATEQAIFAQAESVRDAAAALGTLQARVAEDTAYITRIELLRLGAKERYKKAEAERDKLRELLRELRLCHSGPGGYEFRAPLGWMDRRDAALKGEA